MRKRGITAALVASAVLLTLPSGSPASPDGAIGSISSSRAVPGVKVPGTELGMLVSNGGCVPVDGIVPPCVPVIPPNPFRGRGFDTSKPTLLRLRARVRVESSFIREDVVSGSATVKVQLEVDGNLLGSGRWFTLSGGEKRTLAQDKHFLLPAGHHRIGLKLDGSGYDYVNVTGTSARVRASISTLSRR